MELGTLVGLILGPTLLLIGILLIANLGLYIDPASAMIVVGCTFATFLISNPLARSLKIIQIVMNTLKPYLVKPQEIISTFVSFAEKARRDGLLALEGDIEELKDDFLKKGLQLVVDGTDPALIKSIMEADLMGMEGRHAIGADMLKNMATLAPAFGMIGTLIGLICMLAHMDNPEMIGPSMATALITTMYGSILANLFLLPLAFKLMSRSQEEVAAKEIMIEGMLAIQSGDNPRIVEERLKAFLPPTIRKEIGREE
ncbi:MAG: motility protein A [bacterium]|nr:motility protein A [bacterium]